MNIKFLGTGAYEGIPGLFCDCDICHKSLELGGKNIRKRASILIDNNILIDYTNDVLSYIHNYKLNFSKIQHLLITHSHCDHFNYYDLESKVSTISSQSGKLNIYANSTCIDILKRFSENMSSWDDAINMIELKPYNEYLIGGYTVIPVVANHGGAGEVCFNYIVMHNNKTMLYGTDSGMFCDETWDYIESKIYDCIILDCTYGFNDIGDTSHMRFEDNIEVARRLMSQGCIKEDTPVISNHITHISGVLYDRDFQKFRQNGLTLAYDGMEVELYSSRKEDNFIF